MNIEQMNPDDKAQDKILAYTEGLHKYEMSLIVENWGEYLEKARIEIGFLSDELERPYTLADVINYATALQREHWELKRQARALGVIENKWFEKKI